MNGITNSSQLETRSSSMVLSNRLSQIPILLYTQIILSLILIGIATLNSSLSWIMITQYIQSGLPTSESRRLEERPVYPQKAPLVLLHSEASLHNLPTMASTSSSTDVTKDAISLCWQLGQGQHWLRGWHGYDEFWSEQPGHNCWLCDLGRNRGRARPCSKLSMPLFFPLSFFLIFSENWSNLHSARDCILLFDVHIALRIVIIL